MQGTDLKYGFSKRENLRRDNPLGVYRLEQWIASKTKIIQQVCCYRDVSSKEEKINQLSQNIRQLKKMKEQSQIEIYQANDGSNQIIVQPLKKKSQTTNG